LRPKVRRMPIVVLALAAILLAAMLFTIWALEKGKIKSRHGYQGALFAPGEYAMATLSDPYTFSSSRTRL
jgi:hypothetical protein